MSTNTNRTLAAMQHILDLPQVAATEAEVAFVHSIPDRLQRLARELEDAYIEPDGTRKMGEALATLRGIAEHVRVLMIGAYACSEGVVACAEAVDLPPDALVGETLDVIAVERAVAVRARSRRGDMTLSWDSRRMLEEIITGRS